MKVRTDKRLEFALPPEALWPELTDIARYQDWWPWLRHFDGQAFETGELWNCAVRPPLPYSVRFSVHLLEVVPLRSVRAEISGDVEGTATLDLEPTAEGVSTALRLAADLAGASRLLRMVSRVAPPVARFGHDWVIDTGLDQFEERLRSRTD